MSDGGERPDASRELISADRWTRLEPLFDAALELPREQRTAFLEAKCSGDPALRAEMDRFLAEHDRRDSLLDHPAAERFATLLDEEMAPAIGKSLPDELQALLGSGYTVERELGGGGMSRVFIALDNRLGRKVVMKVLAPELAAAISLERFEREIRIAASLQHPNIVPLLSAGDIAGLPFYSMPFVEGSSLRGRLATSGPPTVAESVAILRDVARALAYAHEHGVVHRDIKPANVLLSGDAAVVTDFGIAKALVASRLALPDVTLTQAGASVGTPAYMSPEQASGDPGTDHRTDLYAFGCLAYELLVGRSPFDGLPLHRLLTAHLLETPRAVILQRPDTPRGLSALIARCLEKAPAARPQSAREILGDLDALTLLGRRPVPHAGVRRPGLLVGTLIALAAALAGGYAMARGRGSVPVTEAKSLAVLPFMNVSGDTAAEYFADGMTEELITALGPIEGLRVLSRTSVFAIKGHPYENVKEIGRKLGADMLLEANVRRDGARVRVSAHLVDVSRDSVVWSEEFTSKLERVFDVQDSIAHAIVSALKLTVGGARGRIYVTRATADPEAHDLYLRGRSLVASRNSAALHRAIDAFQAALARDPQYAAAFSGIADAWSLLTNFGDVPPHEAFPKAKAAALRALALDSTLAEAHTSLAIVLMFAEWDWNEAERHLLRAITLNPNYATAHQFYAWHLVLHDHGEESFRELRLAQRLDPLSLIINARMGTLLSYLGRDAESRLWALRALSIDSTFVVARAQLARTYVRLGKFPEALAVVPPLEEVLLSNIDGATPVYVAAMSGRREEARRILARLEAFAQRQYFPPDILAGAYASLGETDKAFAALERAAGERSFSLAFSEKEPMFAPLRSDPRFAALMRHIHLR
ncbi:MAG TPA: protein kinase [Gemmatimonadaceae bacterium]|nr:protein kinase [Gemmatimonadaceae bacterium]